MKYPDTWSQLTQDSKLASVIALRSLRPANGDYFQFVNGNELEHAGVHNLYPYGSGGISQALGEMLLRQQFQGHDYTIFEIPRDMVSWQQIITGTGPEKLANVRENIRELGKFVSLLLDKTPTPPLSLDDFGLDRATGNMALLPFVELGQGSSRHDLQLVSISHSIEDTLPPSASNTIYRSLVAEFAIGLGD